MTINVGYYNPYSKEMTIFFIGILIYIVLIFILSIVMMEKEMFESLDHGQLYLLFITFISPVLFLFNLFKLIYSYLKPITDILEK